MSCTYEEYDPEAVGATAVGLHVALGIGVLGLLIMVPLILYHKAALGDRPRTVLLLGTVATSILWVATFMTWTFANPGFVGPPIVLRSLPRGPYFGSTLIPWASNAVVRPGKIVRACTEAEAVAAVDAEPESGSVRVVGSGHSFAALYETRGTSLYLDWCGTPELLPVEETNVINGNWDAEQAELGVTRVIRIDAGCKIRTLIDFAASLGLEVHGTGSIMLQTVGGGLGTDLHGVDPWGFSRFIHGLRVYDGTLRDIGGAAAGKWEEVLPWWSALGRRGIILRADIRVTDATTVVRTITTQMQSSDVVSALARTIDATDTDMVGAVAHSTLSDYNSPRWSLGTFTDPQAATAIAQPIEPQSSAWTYAFDNVVIPLVTVAPWLAMAQPGGDSAFLDKSTGRMAWSRAQIHVTASVAATGEVSVPMANCEKGIEAVLEAARANNVGPVDFLIRPRRAPPDYIYEMNGEAWPNDWAAETGTAGACCIDYGLLPPLSAGTTVKFHEDAAALLAPLGAVPHSGKMWAAAQPEELAGAPSKFRWVAKQEYVGTVDPDSYEVLDARRLAWVGLLITTWIVAAAVAFSPLVEPVRQRLGSKGYLKVPNGAAFI